MYDPETGDRLRAAGSVDESNRIHLTKVEIKPSP
jgi:hypothetical protein